MHRRRRFPLRRLGLLLAVVLALPSVSLGASPALGSPSNGHITGLVTAPGGTPLSNVWISVGVFYEGNWTLAATASSGFDGRYELDVPAGGPHQIAFSHPDYVTRYDDLPVTAGATTVADAELVGAGHVTGTVTGAGDVGVSDVKVSAWRLDGDDWLSTGVATYTDDDGAYDLRGLPAGGYRLRFERPSGSDYSSEWWDDAQTVESATTVQVTAGAATSGKDARLETPAAPLVANTAPPSITGSARVGATVIAAPGTWTPTDSSTAYQWLVDESPVAGATAASYTPRVGDLGKSLQVRVTASSPEHTPATATSVAGVVAKGVLTTTKKPHVTGKAKKNATLKVSPGAWNPKATASYRWYAAGKALPKATAAKLKLTGKTLKTVAGKAITVVVRVTAPGYAPYAVTLKVAGKIR